MCPKRAQCGPSPLMFKEDLLAIAKEHNDEDLQRFVNRIMHSQCPAGRLKGRQYVTDGVMALLLDPVAVCKHADVTVSAAKQVQRLCAAYVLGVGSIASDLSIVDFDAQKWRHALPDPCQVLEALEEYVSPILDSDGDSDAEFWMHEDDVPGDDAHQRVENRALQG